jgi:hypothetical protein
VVISALTSETHLALFCYCPHFRPSDDDGSSDGSHRVRKLLVCSWLPTYHSSSTVLDRRKLFLFRSRACLVQINRRVSCERNETYYVPCGANNEKLDHLLGLVCHTISLLDGLWQHVYQSHKFMYTAVIYECVHACQLVYQARPSSKCVP